MNAKLKQQMDSNEEKNLLVVNEDTYELNIQPAASILNVFSRLSYKAWYAIAEFVDNSTQSYISHVKELESDPTFDKLRVKVKYDSEANSLIIIDNAFGMEIEKFKDAILLDSKNAEQIGRNEFGMGLKTAASWFGNVWSVISTQYGSTNKYTATVNIPLLKAKDINSIQIIRETVSAEEHGTIIYIQDVTKKITAPRTIGKIREILSSMYRRDINNRNIEIEFCDVPISFEPYPVLNNFRGKEWKKPLDFTVSFEEKEYRVTGFVAIMNPGSFPRAGFALFRQDRVVVGGVDENYKPSKIFGQSQSQRALKLFGELNMNDFPVNQAKDGFIWDDGLEDAFIDALKSNIQEYIEIADLSKKDRDSELQFTKEKSEQLNRDVSETVATMAVSEEQIQDHSEVYHANDEEQARGSSEVQEYIDTVLNIEMEEQFVGTNRHYDIPINAISTLSINVQWAIGTRDYWIDYKETDDGSIDVVINIDHPFFMPYSKDESFKKVLEKFVLAFVVAEQQAKRTSNREGYIHASTIKNYMNRYLSKMAED